MLSNKFRINAALTETADAFDPQLPLNGPMQGDVYTPAAIELIGDDKAILRYQAPEAQTVTVRLGWSEGTEVPMSKGDDGVWSATIDVNQIRDAGSAPYTTLFFFVDGTYALNPMAPIGWSHAHPINIIEFPSPDTDYYQLQDVPHGTVTRDYYYSETCGCWKSCLIYLPPGYQKGEYQNLPVLYLQHGYGENETSWVHLGKANWIMDNLIAAGKVEPFIIVMNNGMVQQQAHNGERTWNPMLIERLLIDDCIPHIEANYRVATDKWHRAMAGLSMGSMQTSIVTLMHPELFGYAGIFSGFLGKLGSRDEKENPHFAAFGDKAKLASDYRVFFRSIGDADNFIEQYHNESQILDQNNLRNQEEWPAYNEVIYSGGHDWNVWRQSLRDYLQLIFR